MPNKKGSRDDKQCATCGRFRHRTCKDCGQGNLIPDISTGLLVDHENRTLHVCGMAKVTTLPRQTAIVASAPDARPTQALEKSGGANIAAVVASGDASQFIPPKDVLKSYISRKIDGHTDLEVMEIAYRARKNVLLIGDAGTGKNHLIEALGAKLSVPTVAINLNGGSTIEDIVGQPLFIGGETVWADGMLPYLMRMPSILCLDEINACPNEISFVLHQIMDWRRRLVLVQKGREIVTAHPEFMIVGTMNPDYRGTRPLNEAFKDRFHITLELDYDRKVEKKLGIPERVLNLADQLRESYRKTEIETPCSTRMLIDYKENNVLFGETVARECFIARYGTTDKDAVKQAMSLHLDGQAPTSIDDEEDDD